MPQRKLPSNVPRIPLIIAAVILLVLVAGAVVGLVVTQAAPAQPTPYSHAAHIDKGMQCLFCHTGAATNVSAGLPTKEKCQGCHSNMPGDKPGMQAWMDYAAKNEKIEWVPVAIMPDFVYFSHQPHMAANLNCENCHGDVGKMAEAKPRSGQNMGWCLDCHRKLAPDKVVKLTDCSTCHK